MDTRKSLEDEILSWLDESSDTDTTQRNVRNALVQSHVKRVTENDWPFMLWREPKTFEIVAGQRNYVLHEEYQRSFYFRNLTDNVPMREKPVRHLQTSSEEKNRFVLWNRSPVSSHPADASKLSLVSTYGADSGTDKGIYVRGETASGMQDEVINPNGLTPVESINTYLPNGILQLSKFGTWGGTLTVTADAGDTTVVVLNPDENGRSYQQIRLLWTPDSPATIEYQFFRNPSPLAHDYSMPDIPYPHARILVWDALVAMAAYDGRLDAGRLKVWQGYQAEMDINLRQTLLEAQSLDAEANSIHDIEDDGY